MKISKTIAIVLVALSLPLTFSSCEDGVAIFSINDDISFGQQTAAQIESDPAQFPILDKSENKEAYAYLQAITNEILNSGEIKYKSEFAWKIHIIDKEVLNAFATPGGYIYVYTGLIKYLDTVDDLAGVMGHEIAHADRRHSSKQLQRQYGVGVLLQFILGDNSVISNIGQTLLALDYGRDQEADADEQSVKYLAKTQYACNGAATFFEKLLNDGATGNGPEFLSTHPSPKSRVQDINNEATSRGCSTEKSSDDTNGMKYSEFKALF